ncbi:MAG TPA: MotA/TolQ/ExbB proton channel family protein [Planctomycetota bacterium]|nr:MotA/TolQ/ExbB proton channel family protein [Planctomycetota bacterium]
MKRTSLRGLAAGVALSLWLTACAARAAEPAGEAPPEKARPAAAKKAPEKPKEPFSIKAALEDLKRQWEAGGATMYAILFLSIGGLAFILERAFRLRRRAIAPEGLARRADKLWRAGRYDELEALCSRTSPFLTVDDVLDWPAFCTTLAGGQGAAARLLALLPDEATGLVQAGAKSELKDSQKGAVVKALNRILRSPEFYREEDFHGLSLPKEAGDLLARDPEDLSPAEVQSLNRLLLHAALPGEVAGRAKRRVSSLGRVIAFIVRHRGNPINDVSAAVGDIASRDIGRHMLLLYPLAPVAVISPLLGLFGTVVGMIEAFEVVATAGVMGDPSLLASSISKALVTTAWGLIVAMPTLFFYHLFKLRTNALAKLLEEEGSTLLTDWLMKKEEEEA